MTTYNTIDRKGDRNSCTVIALSVIANIAFEDAQKILSRAGRKFNKGFNIKKWVRVAKRYGKLDQAPLWGYRFKQVRTLFKEEPEYLSQNTVIVLTSRHVFVVKDGNIEDWMTKGRRHEIRDIWTFTPKRKRK
tara:strand:- start:20294 stop:20692 length:399 start_codon:yes stop_codon:yes gene_type:complete